MPRNIEIKAKIVNAKTLKRLTKELCDSEDYPQIIKQSDTFFLTTNGRLKLRVQSTDPPNYGQLVYYEREDKNGPKSSIFQIIPTQDAKGLIEILSKSIGIKGQVNKKRTLYIIGQTRVHIDKVEGLGHYMELEVMMQENQTNEEGQAIAEDLMRKLNIQPEQLIDKAYIDILK